MIHINSCFVDSIDETTVESLFDSSEMISAVDSSPTFPFCVLILTILQFSCDYLDLLQRSFGGRYTIINKISQYLRN